MRIIVLKDLLNNCIVSVSSMGYYSNKKKSEEEVEKAVSEFNMRHNDKQYILMECSEEIHEVVCFLLGTGKYKAARSFDDIFLKLTEIKDKTESIHCDLINTMDDIDRRLEEDKKKLEEKEKQEQKEPIDSIIISADKIKEIMQHPELIREIMDQIIHEGAEMAEREYQKLLSQVGKPCGDGFYSLIKKGEKQ